VFAHLAPQQGVVAEQMTVTELRIKLVLGEWHMGGSFDLRTHTHCLQLRLRRPARQASWSVEMLGHMFQQAIIGSRFSTWSKVMGRLREDSGSSDGRSIAASLFKSSTWPGCVIAIVELVT
jgi:hypothetical protein